MKHTSRIVWGLCLCLGATAAGSVHAQTLPFKSPNGYQFAIPAHWRMAYLNGPDIVLLAPPSLQGTNITVVANDAPPDATLEAVRDAVNHSTQHPTQGYRQLAQTLTVFNGERVLDSQVTYELPPPMSKTWARQVIFLKSGKEYELTCTTALADKSVGSAIFDTLLKTLRWTAPLAPFTDEEFKKIDTSSPAYAFVVPAGWTRDSAAPGAQSSVILAGPEEHGFAPNISIASSAAGSVSSVEAEQAIINAQYPRTLPHYALQAQWFTSVDGAPALETCYTVGEGKRIMRGVQVFALKDGQRYTLTGTFPSAGYEQDQAAFDRLLASVRWAGQ